MPAIQPHDLTIDGGHEERRCLPCCDYETSAQIEVMLQRDLLEIGTSVSIRTWILIGGTPSVLHAGMIVHLLHLHVTGMIAARGRLRANALHIER